MLLQMLSENPIMFVLLFSCLVISLSIHEFAHAFSAHLLGDNTAKDLGRLTLNPLKHLDPFGTLLLLVVGFGWGKPVPFNPYNLKNPRRDGAVISFAGPLSNLLIAGVFAVIFRVSEGQGSALFITALSTFAYLMVYFNLFLAFFNLIPVHPLDGFKVVFGLLPRSLAVQWIQMEQYGMFILLILVVTRSTGILIQPFVDISIKLLGVGV